MGRVLARGATAVAKRCAAGRLSSRMSDTAPLPASRSDNTGGWLAALLIAATFFIAGAPTLSWLEFASGMENLNASTVLEIHRNGRWLVPTLEGEPRTAKPPFPTWISAITVRAQ